MMTVEFISAIIVFFAITYLIWYVLEWKFWIPKAFDYKPFSCRKCLTFWTLLFTAVGGTLSGFGVFGITLAVVACLNAAAMIIDERVKYGN